MTNESTYRLTVTDHNARKIFIQEHVPYSNKSDELNKLFKQYPPIDHYHFIDSEKTKTESDVSSVAFLPVNRLNFKRKR